MLLFRMMLGAWHTSCGVFACRCLRASAIGVLADAGSMLLASHQRDVAAFLVPFDSLLRGVIVIAEMLAQRLPCSE